MEKFPVEVKDISDGPLPSNGFERPPRLWGWNTILSGIGALIFLGVLATFVDWRSVWQEFLAAKKTYILFGAVFHYLTYPIRGLRWCRCLAHLPINGSRTSFGLVVFFYNFVDNVVPGKLGDIYGSHMARINFGIRRSEAMGSILFQRTLDGWIVLFVALAASMTLLSTQLPRSVLWALICGGVIALGATTIMLVFFLLDRALPKRIPDKIKEMIRAFRKGMWPSKEELLPILVYSGLIWTLETLWIYFLAYGFGLVLTTSELLFLTMIPLLASAFPLTPSGAGVVELTLFSCLRVVGVSIPLAGSITVINRFLDYWLHIVLGPIVFLFRRQLGLHMWRDVREEGKIDTDDVSTYLLHREDVNGDAVIAAPENYLSRNV